MVPAAMLIDSLPHGTIIVSVWIIDHLHMVRLESMQGDAERVPNRALFN